MHGIVFQISTSPIDSDDYIGIDTVSEGDMAGFNYLYDTEEGERSELIHDLVERILPKVMFTLDADNETIVYQGGFEEWRKSYLDLIRTKTEAIDEGNIMKWIGPVYQLQKAIVNPLESPDYFVLESDSYGTAERSRELMLMVGKLEAGAKIYVGEILGYHT